MRRFVAAWGHCCVALLLALGTVGSVARPVFAEASADDAEYQTLVDHAVDAFEAGDVERAHEQFQKAFALRPNARVRRGLGITALRLARYSEARQQLSAALTDVNQPLNAKQHEEVTRLLAWIASNLGIVHLHVTPRADQILVDDEPVAPVTMNAADLALAPGIHRVRVSAAGFAPQERTVDVAAAQEDTLALTLVSNVPSPARVAAAAPVVVSTPHEAMTPQPAIDPGARAPVTDSPSVFERWWFWTAVGVVVVASAATTIALATQSNAKPSADEPGTKLVLLRRSP
jgi:hypothetical protein